MGFRHFIFANAMVSFEQLISSYPGPLEIVSILVSDKKSCKHPRKRYWLCLKVMIQFLVLALQCPDPHFKKRHQKRRVVQKPLVNSILQNLKPGGKVKSSRLPTLPFVLT